MKFRNCMKLMLQKKTKLNAALVGGAMDKFTTRGTKESVVKEAFLKWIIINRLPFNTGESEYFRDFCNTLSHSVQLRISGENVRNMAIYQFSLELHEDI